MRTNHLLKILKIIIWANFSYVVNQLTTGFAQTNTVTVVSERSPPVPNLSVALRAVPLTLAS